MNRASVRIVPMTRSHLKACEDIVAASEPWKTLKEKVDFAWVLSRNRAFHRAYVCMMGKETVGFAVFTPEPVFARGGYLRSIGVAPCMRRLGIGRKLLSFVEKRTSKKSPNLYLCVSSFNRPAQAFYKRMGYARVGTLPDLIVPGYAEHIYRKRLRQAVRTKGRGRRIGKRRP